MRIEVPPLVSARRVVGTGAVLPGFDRRCQSEALKVLGSVRHHRELLRFSDGHPAIMDRSRLGPDGWFGHLPSPVFAVTKLTVDNLQVRLALVNILVLEVRSHPWKLKRPALDGPPPTSRLRPETRSCSSPCA